MTTEQLDKVDAARVRLGAYSHDERISYPFKLALRSLSDVLGVLDDQMGKISALAREVEEYRAGKGIRAKNAVLRDENAGLRAQVAALESYLVSLMDQLDEANNRALVAEMVVEI